MAIIRLTAPVLAEIFALNEGYSWQPPEYVGRNFSESRTYTIQGGRVVIRERGKTSWADSRYDNTRDADHNETLRAIRSQLHALVLPTK